MSYWHLTIFLLLPLMAMCGDERMPLSIKEVKKQHETRLLQLPGVVSVGIGLNENGQSAIVVGLDKANPETEARLPSQLEGFPVLVRIVGPLKAQ